MHTFIIGQYAGYVFLGSFNNSENYTHYRSITIKEKKNLVLLQQDLNDSDKFLIQIPPFESRILKYKISSVGGKYFLFFFYKKFSYFIFL